MSVKEIETAIAQLTPAELAKLAEWFDRFYAQAWDEQIARDARAGRLDAHIRQARAEHESGRSQPC
jgi:hypothetical protein